MSRYRNAKAESAGWTRYAKPIGFSVLFGIAMTAVFLLLLSVLLTMREIPHSFVNPLAVTAASLGTLAAGYLCARLLKQRGLLFGFVCGISVFLVLLLAGLFLPEHTAGILMLYKFLAIAAAGMLGGVLGVNTGTRH